MSKQKTQQKKRVGRRTAFVPRLVLASAFASVVPACGGAGPGVNDGKTTDAGIHREAHSLIEGGGVAADFARRQDARTRREIIFTVVMRMIDAAVPKDR